MHKDWLKAGNRKVDESVALFNLPTCVCAQLCAGCYAKRDERYPSVVKARMERLALTKNPMFTSIIVNELKRRRFKYCRPHESGDFYCQDYVLQWAEIARRSPRTKFFAYTKANLDFSELDRLKNFNLIRSFGPEGQVNYGPKAELETWAGYHICPDTLADGTGNICMSKCKLCLHIKQVCFVKH